MILERALERVMEDDATLFDLCGERMYGGKLAQDEDYPAITFRLRTRTRESAPLIARGTATYGLFRSLYWFFCVAEEYADAKAVDEALRQCLTGLSGVVSDGESPESTLRINNISDPLDSEDTEDDATRTWSIASSYDVWAWLPIPTDNTLPTEDTAVTYRATITLTNAQFKALPTEPVTIVAAAGAGKVAIPRACYGVKRFAGGAYSGFVDGDKLVIHWDGLIDDGVFLHFQDFGAMTDFMGADDLLFIGAPIQAVHGELPNLFSLDAANRAVVIRIDADTPVDLTGGGPGNTLTIVLDYTIEDI